MESNRSLSQALSAALAEAEQRRDRAAADLEASEKLLQALRFTMELQAHTNISETPEALNGHADESEALRYWRALSRRAAILGVLAEDPRPLSPKSLTTELHRRGRTDASGGVSATLSRLKDDGKVTSPAYGSWQLVDALPVTKTEERPDEDA